MKFRITAIASIIALAVTSVAFAADTTTPQIAAQPAKPVKLVDINTASEEQLKTIPGVNDEYAKKIIAGRPYKTTEQLKSKEVIPADLYSKINKLIKALC